MKSEFLSRMSHDIRTPMNAIIGFTELALEEVEISEKVKDYLQKIDTSSKFLLALLNDVLDMSKIDSGVLKLYPEQYSYDEFIKSMKTMFDLPCNEKDICFKVQDNIEKSTDETENSQKELILYVDKVRFNQIFFNLLSNAVKFTPKGGEITMRTENYCIQDKHLLIDFIIEDTGIGMSEEFQQRLFEPFERECCDYAHDLSGTGLGLTIANRLVQMMGGFIAVKSQYGKGSQFRVHMELPLVLQDISTQGLKEKSCDIDLEQLKDKRVLVAEDHVLNMEIVTRILKKKGMEVVPAYNGEEAVRIFEESEMNRFDVVLMDIRMPVMDGWTAARQIRMLERKDAKTIPIIAMTANTFANDIEESKKAGMNAHLAKPVDVEKLCRTLVEYM